MPSAIHNLGRAGRLGTPGWKASQAKNQRDEQRDSLHRSKIRRGLA